MGKLSGADAIISGIISQCEVKEYESKYEGSYYTADCKQATAFFKVEIQVLGVETGEIIWADEIEASGKFKGYSSAKEKDVQKTDIIINQKETIKLLDKNTDIPPAKILMWTITASRDDVITAKIHASKSVNVFIKSDSDPNYKYINRTNFKSDTITFNVPETKNYYLAIENENILISKNVTVTVNKTYTKQVIKPSNYNFLIANSERREVGKSSLDYSPDRLREDAIDKAINKLYKKIVPRKKKKKAE